MMATFVFANFFQTTLAASCTSGATSITVASGTGAPTIAAGQQWAIVVQSAATPSVREIMYVTAVAGAGFTVVRGQEGTTALAWSAEDNVFGGNTAGQMAAAGQLAGTQSWSGDNTFTGAVAVINATPGDANPIPITQADARYAALNGNTSEVFNVANATTSTEAVALGQLNAPLGGVVQLEGTNTTLGATVSFTAPGAGILIAMGSRVNSSDAGTTNTGNLYINGVLQATDNTLTSMTHFGFATTSGGSVSAQYVASLDIAFSCNLGFYWIPTV